MSCQRLSQHYVDSRRRVHALASVAALRALIVVAVLLSFIGHADSTTGATCPRTVVASRVLLNAVTSADGAAEACFSAGVSVELGRSRSALCPCIAQFFLTNDDLDDSDELDNTVVDFLVIKSSLLTGVSNRIASELYLDSTSSVLSPDSQATKSPSPEAKAMYYGADSHYSLLNANPTAFYEKVGMTVFTSKSFLITAADDYTVVARATSTVPVCNTRAYAVLTSVMIPNEINVMDMEVSQLGPEVVSTKEDVGLRYRLSYNPNQASLCDELDHSASSSSSSAAADNSEASNDGQQRRPVPSSGSDGEEKHSKEGAKDEKKPQALKYIYISTASLGALIFSLLAFFVYKRFFSVRDDTSSISSDGNSDLKPACPWRKAQHSDDSTSEYRFESDLSDLTNSFSDESDSRTRRSDSSGSGFDTASTGLSLEYDTDSLSGSTAYSQDPRSARFGFGALEDERVQTDNCAPRRERSKKIEDAHSASDSDVEAGGSGQEAEATENVRRPGSALRSRIFRIWNYCNRASMRSRESSIGPVSGVSDFDRASYGSFSDKSVAPNEGNSHASHDIQNDNECPGRDLALQAVIASTAHGGIARGTASNWPMAPGHAQAIANVFGGLDLYSASSSSHDYPSNATIVLPTGDFAQAGWLLPAQPFDPNSATSWKSED